MLRHNHASTHLVPVADFNDAIAVLGIEGWEMVAGIPAPSLMSLELDINVGVETIWLKRALPEPA